MESETGEDGGGNKPHWEVGFHLQTPKVQAWHQWCLAWGIPPLFLRGRALLRGGHAVGGQLVRPEPVLSRVVLIPC